MLQYGKNPGVQIPSPAFLPFYRRKKSFSKTTINCDEKYRLELRFTIRPLHSKK